MQSCLCRRLEGSAHLKRSERNAIQHKDLGDVFRLTANSQMQPPASEPDAFRRSAIDAVALAVTDGLILAFLRTSTIIRIYQSVLSFLRNVPGSEVW